MENKDIMKVLNFNCDYKEPYMERRINGSWTQWGSDNLRGEYLLSLLNRSSKHNAIVKSKSAMIGGQGWNRDNLSTNTILFLNNPENENSLDEILARLSYDLEVFGGFYLNIVWSKDRTRIAEINFIDHNLVRIQEKTGDEEVDSYWYSPDWSKHSRTKPVKYDGFSTKDRKSANQILYVKEFRPGQQLYGIPEYISAEGWISLEGQIEEFHNSSVKNGFHPSMVINFNSGIPGAEEMDNVIRRLRQEYEGASKGGKVIFTFSDGSQNAPVITPINLNDSDKRFLELNNEVTEGILCGHRVINPTLFGIKTAGELGGSNDILDSLAVFNAQYVAPKKALIERVFNRFTRINGLTDKLVINEFKVKLDVQPAISDILSILEAPVTNNQKRTILLSIGYTDETIDGLIEVENSNYIQPRNQDILSVLAAPISDEQKIQILLTMGYSEEVSKSIVTNPNPTPVAQPAPDNGQINKTP